MSRFNSKEKNIHVLLKSSHLTKKYKIELLRIYFKVYYENFVCFVESTKEYFLTIFSVISFRNKCNFLNFQAMYSQCTQIIT